MCGFGLCVRSALVYQVCGAVRAAPMATACCRDGLAERVAAWGCCGVVFVIIPVPSDPCGVVRVVEVVARGADPCHPPDELVVSVLLVTSRCDRHFLRRLYVSVLQFLISDLI